MTVELRKKTIINNVTEMAKALKVTKPTIYRYMKMGMPYSEQANGRKWFVLEDCKAWLLNN
ncbi:MAG: hypothetical protein ACRDDY_02695 [Clostridium sp.]|uniref:hypothetical protein n=1 Tax=Clostridium sp. TaxID=1506 RepID=UPI003EE54517